MPINCIAKIGHLIGAWFLQSYGCRASDKIVIVVIKCIFIIAVMQHAELGDQTFLKQVLPIEVGDEYVVISQGLANVVQAAVGVFLQTSEPGKVVLKNVIASRSEEADTHGTVVEQKTTEVVGEGLNANPYAIKIVVCRHIPQMIIHEGALNTNMAVATGFTVVGVGVH